MISLGSHRCQLLFTSLGSLIDAASTFSSHLLSRIDTLLSSLEGLFFFFFHLYWQILKGVIRLMIMIQLKLLTWFHFIVDAFVLISFRESILTSWKPVRTAASCTVTWACQRNSLCGWTHVRCAVGEFFNLVAELITMLELTSWNSFRYCLPVYLYSQKFVAWLPEMWIL